MNDDNEDLALSRRLHALRDLDAAGAPSYHRILRGRGADDKKPHGYRLLLRAVVTTTACALAAAVWWRTPDDALPEPSRAALESLETAGWLTPTDALLADAVVKDAPSLSREITEMLKR